jgi:ribosomal protein S27AE
MSDIDVLERSLMLLNDAKYRGENNLDYAYTALIENMKKRCSVSMLTTTPYPDQIAKCLEDFRAPFAKLVKVGKPATRLSTLKSSSSARLSSARPHEAPAMHLNMKPWNPSVKAWNPSVKAWNPSVKAWNPSVKELQTMLELMQNKAVSTKGYVPYVHLAPYREVGRYSYFILNRHGSISEISKWFPNLKISDIDDFLYNNPDLIYVATYNQNNRNFEDSVFVRHSVDINEIGQVMISTPKTQCANCGSPVTLEAYGRRFYCNKCQETTEFY